MTEGWLKDDRRGWYEDDRKMTGGLKKSNIYWILFAWLKLLVTNFSIQRNVFQLLSETWSYSQKKSKFREILNLNCNALVNILTNFFYFSQGPWQQLANFLPMMLNHICHMAEEDLWGTLVFEKYWPVCHCICRVAWLSPPGTRRRRTEEMTFNWIKSQKSIERLLEIFTTCVAFPHFQSCTMSAIISTSEEI